MICNFDPEQPVSIEGMNIFEDIIMLVNGQTGLKSFPMKLEYMSSIRQAAVEAVRRSIRNAVRQEKMKEKLHGAEPASAGIPTSS